ncbi:terminase large subunit domain-containing protein [Brevundimonas sp.]|jgi:hypothetical protein|uniref:terminase large subunit domain-containing protein n=1 Tax=Brevundimonas sp. TaxID=1871086 RepID=UPI0037851A95
MALSVKQQLIAESKSRFRVVLAGRRGGKTFLAMREVCRFASKPNSIVWMLANSRQQIKSLVWTKLKKKLSKLNWILSTNESELSIILKNNSLICLKSAEQGDNLRGESLDFVCIDEFCDIDLDEIFHQIIRPALSDKKGHALFTGTPKAGNQAARDLYDNHLTKKNWASFSYSTAEGGFVDEEEIEQARQDLSPKVFSQEYLANWENFAGVIFGDFGSHNIREVRKPGPNEPILVGMDFNVTPMSVVLGRQIPNGVEIYDEIYLENSNTTEIISEIRSRYPANPIVVFPDPAGVQRKSSAGGNTDIKLLEIAGFQTRYHRQHPLVRDRINSGNSLFFLREDGSTRFYIDPSCKKTIACLKNWAYKPDTMTPDKNSGFDHGCDALTYMLQFLYPINKTVAASAPQRFGHSLAK